MAIKLKWANPNTFATTVEIYRGDTSLDRANLANPVATLTNGETEWVDATAVFDRVYYYVLVTKRGTDVAIGPNNRIETIERKGAGPNTLKYGDDRLGYYGQLTSSDFFTSTDILAAAKSTVGLPAGLISPIWHKFSRNGKTLYVPNQLFAMPIVWNDLYKAGLVYGTDDAGPVTGRGGMPATNQLVKLTRNGDEYLVRLPMGFRNEVSDVVDLNAIPSDASNTNYINLDNASYRSNRIEFNDIIYPLFSPMPEHQRLLNIQSTDPDVAFGSEPGHPYMFKGIACQECRSDNYAMIRGRSYYGAPLPRPKAMLSSMKLGPTAGGTYTVHQHGWMPVIELIVPVSVVL